MLYMKCYGSCSSEKWLCFLMFRALPEDNYGVRVSVDGVPIPFSSICNGNTWDYWCMFYVRWTSLCLLKHNSIYFLKYYSLFPKVIKIRSVCFLQSRSSYTPTIQSIGPLSGPPGELFISLFLLLLITLLLWFIKRIPFIKQ